jgi:hypothetical protein
VYVPQQHRVFKKSARRHAVLTGLSWFSSILSGNCRDNAMNRPQPFPFKSFPIHYSLIILSIETTESVVKLKKC